MTRLSVRIGPLLVLVLAIALATTARAREESIPQRAYGDLHWRLLGPFRGGWATAVTGIPGDPATFYLGSADGGVWRTTDAGSSWRPLFEGQSSASIGALAVAPSDPQVIWVGTGQINRRCDGCSRVRPCRRSARRRQ